MDGKFAPRAHIQKKLVVSIAVLLAIVLALLWFVYAVLPQIRGAAPAVQPPPEDIGELLPSSKNAFQPVEDQPLTVHDDRYAIEILADDMTKPREMELGPNGLLWVTDLQYSEEKQGVLYTIDPKSGEKQEKLTYMQNPHGLIFHPTITSRLYVVEEQKLWYADISNLDERTEIATLPPKGRHKTRSLAFTADGQLLVSIGSSCDTCVEENPWYGSVISMDAEGNNQKIYAQGLRNAVFMKQHPTTRAIWVTEMGRDFLGDDLPPDELNVLWQGADYGWPYCYGKQVRDWTFEKNNRSKQSFCESTVAPVLEMPAHSAPLGFAFHNDYIYIAFHGSWNRTEPTGYKVVRAPVFANGKVGPLEDFISGWLISMKESLGRPADIEFDESRGEMYISDDKAGVIYRVYEKEKGVDLTGPNGEKTCFITGCSAQVCSDREVVTDCLYQEQYICYQTATCEVQDTGDCGWTMDTKLQSCLDSFN